MFGEEEVALVTRRGVHTAHTRKCVSMLKPLNDCPTLKGRRGGDGETSVSRVKVNYKSFMYKESEEDGRKAHKKAGPPIPLEAPRVILRVCFFVCLKADK